MSLVVSAFSAVLAGACLAATGVLQQRAASHRPRGERLSLRLLVHLFAERQWVAGLGLAVVSYGFQALALSLGPLVLVQPLVVTELLFAIPVSLRWRQLRLRLRDWLAVCSVVVGLTVGLVAAAPQQGNPLQPIGVWLPGLVTVAVVSGGSVMVARRLDGPAKASAFALAGACVMGMQSALYKASLALLGHEGWHTFAVWQPYALIAASLLGGFLVQNAFHSGPLAASSPVIDSVLVVVTVTLGVWQFGEHVRTSPLGLAGSLTGLLLLVLGIVGLDTSPVVRREQQIDEQNRAGAERPVSQAAAS